MTGDNTKQKKAFYIIAFFVVVFAVTWTLTTITPLVGDDYNYAFSWTDHSRIDNFTLVRQSMKTHRNWTHGRVFAQGWVSLFMMWPKWLFPFANACVVTAFFIALHHYFKRIRIEKPMRACMAVAALFWVCMPAFGQVFLWLDGACNYFWGSALSWILLEIEFSLQDSRYKLPFSALLLPLAFVTGAWSEHISFALLLVQFLYIISWLKHSKTMPVAEILILLTGCAGYMFLMLAPSMLPSVLRRRAIQAAGGRLQALMRLISRKWWLLPILLLCGILIWLLLRKKPDKNARWTAVFMMASVLCISADAFYFVKIFFDHPGLSDIFFSLVSSTQIGFLSLMSVYFICLSRAFAQRTEHGVIHEALILGAGGISALFLFVLAMYIPARGFCAPVVYISIAVVRLYSTLPKNRSGVVFTALLSVFIVFFTVGSIDIISVKTAAVEREKAITAALSSDGILVASPYPEKTKYSAQYGIQDLTDDGSWPNDVMIEYYCLKDICVVAGDD